MINNGLVKGIGLAATILGTGATLISEWVNDQKMNEKIEEKVNDVLSKKEEEKS